jgi:hypothetical protein
MEKKLTDEALKGLNDFHDRILKTRIAELILESEIMAIVNAKEVIAEQKAEIERLTEENKKLSIKVWNYEQPARTPLYSNESMVNCNFVTCYNENANLKAENAELQKQNALCLYGKRNRIFG